MLLEGRAGSDEEHGVHEKKRGCNGKRRGNGKSEPVGLDAMTMWLKLYSLLENKKATGQFLATEKHRQKYSMYSGPKLQVYTTKRVAVT